MSDYVHLAFEGPLARLTLKRGEKPKRGSTIGRQGSAPEGGPLTLTTLKNPAE